jgi:Anion-transporting ATPase
VLLFSVDPQASLSDIFQRDIFAKGPVPIMENLWAQEVDADRRTKDYQEEIRKKILDMYGFDKVPEEIDNYIAAASAEPAMEESAIFDAVVDIIVQGDYELTLVSRAYGARARRLLKRRMPTRVGAGLVPGAQEARMRCPRCQQENQPEAQFRLECRTDFLSELERLAGVAPPGRGWNEVVGDLRGGGANTLARSAHREAVALFGQG